MNENRISLTVLVVLTLAATALFAAMIRPFLMALLVAAIAASLLQGVFDFLLRRTGRRRRLSAVLTILFLVLAILGPLGTIVGLVTAQAVQVAEAATPWVQKVVAEPGQFTNWLEGLPWWSEVAQYEDEILQRVADLVRWLSRWAVENLSAATTGTLTFLFLFAISLYALYYFLLHGSALLDRILWYIPLAEEDERRLVDKFRSVTRATLMGTLVVGAVQGGLAGAALAVAGVPNALFWTVLMVVLSVIPGVGTSLVWAPACLWLAAEGSRTAAIVVAVFSIVVVGGVDNVLRPRLVGRDTAMPDLLILLSTLGGLGMFGVIGLVIGPVLAALFLTFWELYGAAFADVLPAGRGSGDDGGAE